MAKTKIKDSTSTEVATNGMEFTKRDLIVSLLKEKVSKLFDREPTGSLKNELVDQLADEILNA